MDTMTPKETQEKLVSENIREATLDDAFAIAKINYDAWKMNYRGVVDDEYLDAITLEGKEERMLGLMKERVGKVISLVYEEEGKILGVVTGGEKRDEMPYDLEIHAIYVSPDAQGKGIGKKLMNALLQTEMFKDKKSFYLWALRDKKETRKFYDGLGGKICNENMWKLGEKEYPMICYCRQK